MSKENVLEIIKGAILLERKGKSFYANTASQTKSNAVSEFFKNMAFEEDKHIEILSEQYKSLLKDGNFIAVKYPQEAKEISVSVLTKQIMKEITAASYEAAAISAAMALEDKAVKYYSEYASSADNPMEKELLEWLANWEKTHLQLLVDIDKELQVSVWHDNNFWPM